jgi:phospholipid transport system substrate-binding protein
MKTLGKISIAIALFAMLLLPALGNAAVATDQLRGTIDAVIEVLKNPALKGDAKKTERRAKIRGVIAGRFNYTEMAQRTLGKHWQERNAQEKEEFAKLFGALIENSYISKLEGFTNEKVLYSAENIVQSSALVKTRIVTTKGTEIPVDYKLIDKGGNWMVYDVVIEGVSLVANYRTQFNKTLMQSSFDELVKQLKTKTS